MAADLFETYAVTVVATMVLAAIFFAGKPMLAASMIYPLAICSICIVSSIAGTYFVKLGSDNNIMGALYKGLIATGVLSIAGLALATHLMTGWGVFGEVAGKTITGTNLFICGVIGLRGDGGHRLHHRILHGHGQAPGGCRLRRPRLRATARTSSRSRGLA